MLFYSYWIDVRCRIESYEHSRTHHCHFVLAFAFTIVSVSNAFNCNRRTFKYERRRCTRAPRNYMQNWKMKIEKNRGYLFGAEIEERANFEATAQRKRHRSALPNIVRAHEHRAGGGGCAPLLPHRRRRGRECWRWRQAHTTRSRFTKNLWLAFCFRSEQSRIVSVLLRIVKSNQYEIDESKAPSTHHGDQHKKASRCKAELLLVNVAGRRISVPKFKKSIRKLSRFVTESDWLSVPRERDEPSITKAINCEKLGNCSNQCLNINEVNSNPFQLFHYREENWNVKRK